jgi:Ca-activated chloride channel homolog
MIQLSRKLLVLGLVSVGLPAQQSLPSAPQPQGIPAASQSAPAPQANQAPPNADGKAPVQFESLTPRKPAPAPQPEAQPEHKAEGAKPNSADPIGSPDDPKPKPAAAAAAQATSNKPGNSTDQVDVSGDQKYTVRAETREVDVVFTVTDKHGRFVRNLKQEDVRVFDNNKPPAKVVSFAAQTDLPLRVGLLIDASGSIRDRFRFEQEAAAEFMASIIRPSRDKAFIMGFDTDPEVTQDFTNDTAQLAKGIRMLRPAGGTAIFDAIYQACRQKMMRTGDEQPVRKALIILSDGDDNYSQYSREQAIQMAQRAEVIIYAISTNPTNTYTQGDDVLKQIASATGGQAFFPFKVENLSNAFRDVQEELRSQYSIAYVPADFQHDGSFHTIKIEVADKKYTARARRGYFAQRPASAAKGE